MTDALPEAGAGLPAPLATVVIPVRNEAGSIADCLRAVAAQDYPSERLEIFVVDGGSRDGSREIVDRVVGGDARFRRLENPGGLVPVALNLGLRAARGDVFLRIDAHTIVAPDYVRRCVERLRWSGAENVGGPMLPKGVTPLGCGIAAAMSCRFGVGPARFRYAREVEEVDTVYLGAFPRSLFDRVGEFNEAMVRNQDYEMNYRIRRAGGRILVDPAIRSTYLVRPDLESLWQQFASYGYWKTQMLRRHPRSLHPRQLAAPALVAALGLSAVVSAASLAGLAGPRAPALAVWLFPAVAGLYAVTSLLVSCAVGLRRGLAVALPLPAVFATMHLAWGAGFWAGAFFPPRGDGASRARRASGAAPKRGTG
ncbi:MAG: succinoglycan biosynthesis protein ExoA [Acidobacteriota bacterium]|nr:succinoglycan biosynthesis protein ExoA [Acidobacteriota bacterium]